MTTAKLHIIFVFLLLSTAEVFAQFGADFSVISDAGCQSFTVSVIDNSGAPAGNVIVYNYGDGTAETNDTSHTYSSPGIYKIIQTVANGTPRQDSLFVEVIAPQPPGFVVSNCMGTEAFVYITDTLYNGYWVDWGDGNAEKILSGQLLPHDYGGLGNFTVTVKGLMDGALGISDLANVNCSSSSKSISVVNNIVPGSIDRLEVLNDTSIHVSYAINAETGYFLELSENGSSDFSTIEIITSADYPSGFTVSGLNTEANFYCFRLTAFDPCNGTTQPSDIACSVNLSVAAENNQNRLTWVTETTDLTGYDVFKDGSFFSTATTMEYLDTLVECGTVYCYHVVLNENNGLQSVSNTRCDTAYSNDIPTPLNNISASVEDNVVLLNWQEVLPVPEFYEILKSENGNEFPEIRVEENSYTDDAAAPDRYRYYYQIRYEDLCDNQSPTTMASPVFLSNSSSYSLNWSRYLGWEQDVLAYVLEKYDTEGQLLENVDVGLDTTYTEVDFDNLPQQVIYRVRAIPVDFSLPNVYSNFFSLTFPSTVVFPNAFTPNGDGLNDYFNFAGKYVSNYRLTIFTRWGELIFETENVDSGWDGNFNSKPVPSGVYIFNAEFTDEMGVEFSKKGEIYLIR